MTPRATKKHDRAKLRSVGKAEQTKSAILEVAVEIAARTGVASLTIGSLATATGMSKSGLYARFGSVEGLQLAVLDSARTIFEQEVLFPALKFGRGEPRVRALFEAWLALSQSGNKACLFVSAASEFDDQPGPVRDQLVQHHLDFGQALARIYAEAAESGYFVTTVEPEQFAFDLHGIMLVHFYACRLLVSTNSEKLARQSFENLLASIRVHN